MAIETSGTFGSVAVGEGDTILQTAEFATPRAHAVDFLPAVDRLFAAATVHPQQTRFVFVSIGPGSFTGLRIGVTAARMLAFTVGARLVAVPTLDVIAQNALNDTNRPANVVTMLDAKRKRVYATAYQWERGAYVSRMDAAEVEPAAFMNTLPGPCTVLGEGAGLYRGIIESSGHRVLSEDTFRARAETAYKLGRMLAQRGVFTDWQSLVPTYVRPPEAEERWHQRQARGRK